MLKFYNADLLKNLACEAMMKNTNDLIYIKDLNLRYVRCSLAFARLVGFSDTADVVGKTDYELFNKELADKYVSDDKKLLESDKSIIKNIEQIPGSNGKYNYSSTSKFLIKDFDGAVVGLYGIGVDITSEIEMEEEKEFRQLNRQLFDDVFEIDLTEDRIIRAEGSVWARALGINFKSTYYVTVQSLAEKVVHPDYKKDFIDAFDKEKLISGFDSDIKEFTIVSYFKKKGETYRWMEITAKMYFSKFFNTLRMSIYLKNIDEEKRNKELLNLKATTDSLTGICNRDSATLKIKDCIEASSSKKVSHALFFIDLDNFKEVNNNFGHPVGDKVLIEIASKLKSITDESDILARFGGDEFIIFSKNFKNLEILKSKAEKILNSAQYYVFEKGIEVTVTCSIGVAFCESNNKSIEQLYEEADKLMYLAKENGKNGFIIPKKHTKKQREIAG